MSDMRQDPDMLSELLSNVALDPVSRLLLDAILAGRQPEDGTLAEAITLALSEDEN